MDKTTLQITDIPGITAPRGVVFCGNKRVAIIEPETFTVFNTQEQENIIKKNQTQTFDGGAMFDLATSKDGKVALFSDCRLTVYDGSTGKQEWQKYVPYGYPHPIAFNFQDSSQVLLYIKNHDLLHIYSNNANKTHRTKTPPLGANCSFAHHPKTTKIIYGVSKLGACCFTDYEKFINSIDSREALVCPNSYIVGQEYSCDGSYFSVVARAATHTRIIFVPESNGQTGWIEVQKPIVAIAFHPNNKIVIFLDENNNVKCWDFFVKQYAHLTCFSDEEPIPLQDRLEKRLTISPNGKHLCVAFKNKCSIMRLPFDVVYGLVIKEQLFSVVSLLKSYDIKSCDESAENNIISLPQDVIFLIAKKLSKLFRHSFK